MILLSNDEKGLSGTSTGGILYDCTKHVWRIRNVFSLSGLLDSAPQHEKSPNLWHLNTENFDILSSELEN